MTHLHTILLPPSCSKLIQPVLFSGASLFYVYRFGCSSFGFSVFFLNMSILYLHLRWFFFVFVIFLFFFCLSLYVTSTSSIYLSFPLFSIGNIDLNFSVLLDFYSCWFRSVVLLISSIIIVYSYFYMYPYSKSHLFLSLTLMFVFSMLVVVLVSDLFFLMLG